jgi:hypothetical protein
MHRKKVKIQYFQDKESNINNFFRDHAQLFATVETGIRGTFVGESIPKSRCPTIKGCFEQFSRKCNNFFFLVVDLLFQTSFYGQATHSNHVIVLAERPPKSDYI